MNSIRPFIYLLLSISIPISARASEKSFEEKYQGFLSLGRYSKVQSIDHSYSEAAKPSRRAAGPTVMVPESRYGSRLHQGYGPKPRSGGSFATIERSRRPSSGIGSNGFATINNERHENSFGR